MATVNTEGAPILKRKQKNNLHLGESHSVCFHRNTNIALSALLEEFNLLYIMNELPFIVLIKNI